MMIQILLLNLLSNFMGKSLISKIIRTSESLNCTQFHKDQPKRLQMDSLQNLPWPSKCYMGLGIIISEQNCLCNSRTIVANPFQVWRTHLTFPVLVAKGSFVFKKPFFLHVSVSKNNGTPKSSISIGFSIINHPFWGTSIFGNTHVFSPGQDSTDTQQFVTLFFLRCSNFVQWSWHLWNKQKRDAIWFSSWLTPMKTHHENWWHVKNGPSSGDILRVIVAAPSGKLSREMVGWWLGARWFGFLGSPKNERDWDF